MVSMVWPPAATQREDLDLASTKSSALRHEALAITETWRNLLEPLFASNPDYGTLTNPQSLPKAKRTPAESNRAPTSIPHEAQKPFVLL